MEGDFLQVSLQKVPLSSLGQTMSLFILYDDKSTLKKEVFMESISLRVFFLN